VAHHVGAEVHSERPRVSAELPETGERFEGLLPPVITAPAFGIRKPAVAVFTLDDYVAVGTMTAGHAATLRAAVASRKNILVAGGTGTGKTTLTNALLAEIAGTSDRVVLVEDTRELQCRAPNLVAMRSHGGSTARPVADRNRLSRSTSVKKVALSVTLKARPGKEEEVAAFLASAQSLVSQEPGTITWYAFRVDQLTSESSTALAATRAARRTRKARLSQPCWPSRGIARRAP
jgi:hypothetical protein